MASMPLRQSAQSPTGTAVDGTNVAGNNPLVTVGNALTSVLSPFGSAFGQAAQMTPGGKLQATSYPATVSGADSGPNNQPLTIPSSATTCVVSPSGNAFNQAMKITSTSNAVIGPAGDGNGQGAITGTAFSAECLYTVPATVTVETILGRINTALEWQIYPNPVTGGAQLSYRIWDSSGTAVAILGSTTLDSGSTYAIQMSWDGTTLRGFVNGNLDGSVALSSAYAPSATNFLQITGSLDTILDEVRISDIARDTAAYTPATSPFTSDANTDCLYHLDGIQQAVSGAITASAFTAELLYEPTTADLNSDSTLYLAACESSPGQDQWQIGYLPGSGCYVGIQNSLQQFTISSYAPLSAGVSYAIALVWNGTDLLFFLNGTQVGSSVAVSSARFAVTAQLRVGDATLASPVSGVIDEVRISDIARYSASYTPASSPFILDTNTESLFHLDTKASNSTVLTFPPVPLGRVWTGSIVIRNTAPNTTWQLEVGGILWGAITGSGPYGPVQAMSGEKVTLSATTAAPASPVGATVIAYFIGEDADAVSVQYTSPISPSGIITNSA